jgi:glycosyltransferase involved in cell wall biosynthesis
MNILFLCDHYFPYIGGAEIVNRAVAEYFSTKCCISVVSKKFKGLNDKRSEINQVHIYRTVDVPRLLHSLICYMSAAKLARSADLLLSATYASGLAGHWLAQRFKKKSVLLVHEILDENWKFIKQLHSLYYWYERYIVTRKFDHYIAVSQYTKRKMIKYGIREDRISVIYNGMDEGLFYPRPVKADLRHKIAGDAAFVYLFFGRPRGYKGLEYLLRAVPEIAKKIPGSKLILLLGREPRQEYQQTLRLIDQLSIRNNIVLLDPVSREQLPDYINVADSVVIPSLSEGFGYAAVESCMLGKTVVVTDAGSLPEVVFGSVVMIKKADVQSVTEGVCRAYKGESVIIPRKSFKWEDSLKRYDDVIKSVLL